jgi:hypothetical protein
MIIKFDVTLHYLFFLFNVGFIIIYNFRLMLSIGLCYQLCPVPK